MAKNPTSYRLEDDAIGNIKWLAIRLHLSEAQVIALLARERREREEGAVTAARIDELERRVASLENR